ncbi:MAG: VOC family protein [Anaerolineales bacterium]|nr:VOC family protein [Anaerolineales bacterium]
MKPSLPANLTLGPVHLNVTNLPRSVEFYQQALGFRVHRQENNTAYLGAGRTDLLTLTERPTAKRAPRTTGLYHFAILTPSRFELAQSLHRLAETRTPVQGFSDHLVSEAIYLGDPDGHGIEIYRDRPRTDWVDAAGNFRMGSEPLDIDGILAELGEEPPAWSGLHANTVLGHMHLHVRHVPEAVRFYRDVLGFDVMAEWNGAAFVSAGGYHHHLGLNTWGTLNAPPPPPESISLRSFIITLPTTADLAQVHSRVLAAGLSVEPQTNGWLVRDPSQNQLIFTHAA